MLDLARWPELTEGVRRLVADGRWGEASMDEIAAAAGVSRVTLYRRGATREAIVAALREAVAAEEAAAVLPALLADGSARERLVGVLLALCSVSDRNLHLLRAVVDDVRDAVYHEEGDDALTRDEFAAPVRRLLLDGAADGSLRAVDDVQETATVVYNQVGWTYAHLRLAHRWPHERAARAVVGLALDGVSA